MLRGVVRTVVTIACLIMYFVFRYGTHLDTRNRAAARTGRRFQQCDLIWPMIGRSLVRVQRRWRIGRNFFKLDDVIVGLWAIRLHATPTLVTASVQLSICRFAFAYILLNVPASLSDRSWSRRRSPHPNLIDYRPLITLVRPKCTCYLYLFLYNKNIRICILCYGGRDYRIILF